MSRSKRYPEEVERERDQVILDREAKINLAIDAFYAGVLETATACCRSNLNSLALTIGMSRFRKVTAAECSICGRGWRREDERYPVAWDASVGNFYPAQPVDLWPRAGS